MSTLVYKKTNEMKNLAMIWLVTLLSFFGCETTLQTVLESEYTRMFTSFLLVTISGLILKYADFKWFKKRKKDDQ